MFDNGRAVALPFIAAKREVVLESNKDNVVFETGQMKLRGTETIKAGTYLRLIRGASVVGGTLGGGLKLRSMPIPSSTSLCLTGATRHRSISTAGLGS